ncbi:MAG: adenylate kinase [Snowella sp.]|nr:adenylate kinase [Snowella sp.]
MQKGIIFLGPPGSGKGTQGQILAQNLKVPHIATGDILRQAIADKTPLGEQAQSYMDKGELVPDFLILDLIQERLGQPDTENGWILDGFPRNVPQAEFLDQLLVKINQRAKWVIYLNVPDDIIVRRLLLRGRSDDTEDTIRHRLVVYQEQTAPLVAYYQEQGKLYSINGDQEPELVSTILNNLVAS